MTINDHRQRKGPVEYAQFAWGVLLPIFAGGWAMVNKLRDRVGEHDKQLATMKETCEGLTKLASELGAEGKHGREVINKRIESVRRELTQQHETNRKEQRQDFAEIRKSIERLAG